MMLSRIATKSLLRRVVARGFAAEAAPTGNITLNFSLPHETIYKGKEVYSVILPGM